MLNEALSNYRQAREAFLKATRELRIACRTTFKPRGDSNPTFDAKETSQASSEKGVTLHPSGQLFFGDHKPDKEEADHIVLSHGDESW